MSEVVRGVFQPGSVRRGPGLRSRLNRQEVSRWLTKVSGRFPAKSATWKVASVLAAVLGADGRLDPTKAWISAKAGVCERQVARVIKALVGLGFVTYQRRTAVTAGVEHQTSNSYRLIVPESPVESTDPGPESDPVGLSTSPLSALSDNREDSLSSKKGWSDISPPPQARSLPIRIVRAAQKALADRRAAFEAKQRATRARESEDRVRRPGFVPR